MKTKTGENENWFYHVEFFQGTYIYDIFTIQNVENGKLLCLYDVKLEAKTKEKAIILP